MSRESDARELHVARQDFLKCGEGVKVCLLSRNVQSMESGTYLFRVLRCRVFIVA
jgi:hypothetical protein